MDKKINYSEIQENLKRDEKCLKEVETKMNDEKYYRYRLTFDTMIVAKNENEAIENLGYECDNLIKIDKMELLNCIGTDCNVLKEFRRDEIRCGRVVKEKPDPKECEYFHNGKCLMENEEERDSIRF